MHNPNLTEEKLDHPLNPTTLIRREIKHDRPIDGIKWTYKEIKTVPEYETQAGNSIGKESHDSKQPEVVSLSCKSSRTRGNKPNGLMQHLGLDRAKLRLLDRRLQQMSKYAIAGDLNTWNASLIPELSEVITYLGFPVRDYKDQTFLARFLPDIADRYDLGSIIPAKILIKGINAKYWHSFPLHWSVAPRLCLAIAIANDGFMEVNQAVKEFAARLVWLKQPSLVRLHTDIYSVCIGYNPPKVPLSLAKQRYLDKAKKLPHFGISKYIEATEENKFTGTALRHPIQWIDRSNTVILSLNPSHKASAHIADVYVTQISKYATEKVGEIKIHKGKFKFFCPNWTVGENDRQKVDEEMKRFTTDSKNYDQTVKQLKKQISTLGVEITEMKTREKKTSLHLAAEILKKDRERQKLTDRLSHLSKPSIDVKTIWKVDNEILVGVGELFKNTGLIPNQPICSLPPTSQLSSPKFWGDKLGVLVCFPQKNGKDDYTGSLRFYQDLRM